MYPVFSRKQHHALHTAHARMAHGTRAQNLEDNVIYLKPVPAQGKVELWRAVQFQCPAVGANVGRCPWQVLSCVVVVWRTHRGGLEVHECCTRTRTRTRTLNFQKGIPVPRVLCHGGTELTEVPDTANTRGMALYVTHPGQQPIEYAYWYVNRLGYCISIPIDTFDRCENLSIDTYCLAQQVERNWYNRLLFLRQVCECIYGYLFLRPIGSDKSTQQAIVLTIGMLHRRSIFITVTNRYVKLSIDNYGLTNRHVKLSIDIYCFDQQV